MDRRATHDDGPDSERVELILTSVGDGAKNETLLLRRWPSYGLVFDPIPGRIESPLGGDGLTVGA
jgi:hypothetical protein